MCLGESFTSMSLHTVNDAGWGLLRLSLGVRLGGERPCAVHRLTLLRRIESRLVQWKSALSTATTRQRRHNSSCRPDFCWWNSSVGGRIGRVVDALHENLRRHNQRAVLLKHLQLSQLHWPAPQRHTATKGKEKEQTQPQAGHNHQQQYWTSL